VCLDLRQGEGGSLFEGAGCGGIDDGGRGVPTTMMRRDDEICGAEAK